MVDCGVDRVRRMPPSLVCDERKARFLCHYSFKVRTNERTSKYEIPLLTLGKEASNGETIWRGKGTNYIQNAVLSKKAEGRFRDPASRLHLAIGKSLGNIAFTSSNMLVVHLGFGGKLEAWSSRKK